jgi:hypothetical protein
VRILRRGALRRALPFSVAPENGWKLMRDMAGNGEADALVRRARFLWQDVSRGLMERAALTGCSKCCTVAARLPHVLPEMAMLYRDEEEARRKPCAWLDLAVSRGRQPGGCASRYLAAWFDPLGAGVAPGTASMRQASPCRELGVPSPSRPAKPARRGGTVSTSATCSSCYDASGCLGAGPERFAERGQAALLGRKRSKRGRARGSARRFPPRRASMRV